MDRILFSETRIGNISVKNRIVMAPMTRCRAINNIPNSLMAEYYGQRADFGLIITEGTAPSPNGLGYARIPGIFSSSQISGWKEVTKRVHDLGGSIFVQLMHTGRISHSYNMPEGSEIIAPSAIAAKGEMYTDKAGMQTQPVPREMTLSDIRRTRDEFVKSSENAILAGFDGVELHGANGYLMDQFLQPDVNQRKDNYGGSPQKRCLFILEVAKAVSESIGKDKTGIRLSPYGAFNDVAPFDETDEEYAFLAGELNKLGIAYLHLVDHSSMGSPIVSRDTVEKIRKNFKGKLILSGGYNGESAENELFKGPADLIAFGRPALANPDLVKRLEIEAELNEAQNDTFYTSGEKGYTDYPRLS